MKTNICNRIKFFLKKVNRGFYVLKDSFGITLIENTRKLIFIPFDFAVKQLLLLNSVFT